MNVGDIVIVNTYPPHIASVTENNTVICEDGTHLPISNDMEVLCDAMTILKSLEKGVLDAHGTG